ncbi:MAG: hypothetical protein IJ497_05010, partial [Clostridia bacterium]|nr:hypothetical protein [Clostridia bacterium]
RADQISVSSHPAKRWAAGCVCVMMTPPYFSDLLFCRRHIRERACSESRQLFRLIEHSLRHLQRAGSGSFRC